MPDQVNKAVVNVKLILEVNYSNLERVASFLHWGCLWFLFVCLSARTNSVEQGLPIGSSNYPPFAETVFHYWVYKLPLLIPT
jgi:hypothetical protein